MAMEIEPLSETIERMEWFGLYSESWQGEITPEAFAHPAKFNRALIRRIYDWMMENGYIKAGDRIVDPFGGVALGALDAMRLGMHWEGVELEPRFHIMGQGGDCGGFTAKEWRRYYKRGYKIKRDDLCPRCRDTINRMPAKIDMRHGAQISLFERTVRAVPSEPPHHYTGNIERWRSKNLPGTATLHLGDSRNLTKIIGASSAVISSPPFIETEPQRDDNFVYKDGSLIGTTGKHYGSSPGQLGAMSPGNFDAAVSSPPFSPPGNNPTGRGQGVRSDYTEGKRKETTPETTYGHSAGQLGAMAMTDFAAAISSPPYAESLNSERNGIDWKKTKKDYPGRVMHEARIELAEKHHNERRYGQTSGQLGGMKEGEFEVAISSPPYADAVKIGEGPGASGREASRIKQQTGESAGSSWNNDGRYGLTPGQLGNMSDKGMDDNEASETFWQAARTIVEETYNVLKPGGVAAWVTGDFVRNGQRVPFGEQWLAMCEAVGFEPLAWAVAWKTEHKGTQLDIFGNAHEKRVDRVSFFRQLANKRNPEAAILNEDVVFVRKP
jgi:hypothetical protein